MYTRFLALIAAAFFVVSANTAFATVYSFSYEFPPGQVNGAYEGFGTIITGSFEGTDDGTFITYTSNLNVSLNGASFPAGLYLYTWTGSGPVSGPGKFAFDGPGTTSRSPTARSPWKVASITFSCSSVPALWAWFTAASA